MQFWLPLRGQLLPCQDAILLWGAQLTEWTAAFPGGRDGVLFILFYSWTEACI